MLGRSDDKGPLEMLSRLKMNSFLAYRRNGDGSESKWVANDVSHADAAAAVLPGVFHFL